MRTFKVRDRGNAILVDAQTARDAVSILIRCEGYGIKIGSRDEIETIEILQNGETHFVNWRQSKRSTSDAFISESTYTDPELQRSEIWKILNSETPERSDAKAI